MKRRFPAAFAAALISAAVVFMPTGAAATSTKYFSVSFDPPSAVGGVTSGVTLTLANCDGTTVCSPASTQSLGAANVTPAAGFSVAVPSSAQTPVSAGGKHWSAQVVSGVLQLRALSSGDALAPGDTLPVSLSVTTPCSAPQSSSWPVSAKQSNSFNGPPGNDFTQVGTLALGIDGSASGPLTHFGITLPSSPFTATAGAAFAPTITALDVCNRTVTGYDGTVGLTGLAAAPDGTQATPSSVTLANGTATPVVTAYRAASGVTLSATDAEAGATGSSAAFDVAPGAADHVAFTSQPPANVQTNTGFATTVTVLDRWGNVATGAAGTVALQLNSPTSTVLGGVGATLGPAGSTSVAANQGIAAFTGLTVDTTGTGYTLSAAYTGATGAQSAPFDAFDVLGTCPTTGCQASNASTQVNVQPPRGQTGQVGVGLNPASTTCGSLSSLGSLFIVKPLFDDPNFDITVTLTINRFYLNGIGVANIGVCKNLVAGGTTLSPLPDCPKKGAPTGACVVSRTSSNAGDAILTIVINSVDPIGGGFG